MFAHFRHDNRKINVSEIRPLKIHGRKCTNRFPTAVRTLTTQLLRINLHIPSCGVSKILDPELEVNGVRDEGVVGVSEGYRTQSGGSVLVDTWNFGR
jgi:hypothetical protein